MKLKKFLATILSIATFCSFTVISQAALVNDTDNFYTFKTVVEPAEIDPGDTVTIKCYVLANDGNQIEITQHKDSMVKYAIRVPKNVFAVTETTRWNRGDYYYESNPDNDDGTVSVSVAGDDVIISFTEFFTYAGPVYTATQPVCSFEMKTEDTAPAGDVSAKVETINCALFDAGQTPNLNSSAKINVNEGSFKILGEAGPTVTKGNTANGITEYTFANSEEFKTTKVLMTEAATAGSAITADTRFKVTKDGREQIFGSDIWGKLAQGGGSISVESTIKFGLIVDKDADASAFTFEIIGLQQ